MKIAWFTPFCTESAIGKYSDAILDHLRAEHEVTVFATGLAHGPSLRPELPTVRIDGRGGTAAVADEAGRHDVAVYNLGNNGPYHADIYRSMQALPGVVVIHDVANFSLLLGVTDVNGRRDLTGWLAEMKYSHGPEGTGWDRGWLTGQTLPGQGQEDVLQHTLLRSCVRRAVGVVTHGEWARRAVEAITPVPVTRIEFPRFLGPDRPPAPAVATDGRVRLMTFGGVSPNKASDLVIESLATSERLRAGVRYTIAGSLSHREHVTELRRLIALHQLQDVVRLIDRPDDATLGRLVAEADVIVNLRYPHLGECSGSLQEALLYGKPTVVWAHGYYDEFPDDVVVKVRSLPELTAALERLSANPAERSARGVRSREHAEQRFQTPRYCHALVPFLERCRAGRPVCEWLDRLADQIADLPPGPSTEELVARVAEEVAALASRPGAARAEAA